ncbi:MAG: PA2778 family cysteine peptidase [Alphaproteobacteria bacterium]
MSSALPTRAPRSRRLAAVKASAAGIALFLAACATPQTDSLKERPWEVAPTADVLDAPFFAQRTKECGPAALAMALAASGLKVDPDALVAEVYTPAREGSLTTDILSAARRHGRVAYRISGMRDMFRQIAAGKPVVVLQNLALPVLPQWHYAVVVGYDIDEGTLTLHSGKTPRLTMPMETFERTWQRADYWGLLVLAPGQLPVEPELDRYLQAVTGLEHAKKFEAAQAAYIAGSRNWPDNLPLAMGIGNTHYELGNLHEAAVLFEWIGRDHPNAGDAFNNLAHVRLDMGNIPDAEKAAQRAVALGGPNIDVYRETLASIQKTKAGKTSTK